MANLFGAVNWLSIRLSQEPLVGVRQIRTLWL